MTTASEGQELTRVGPGTPMGELMRQYWLPAVKSSEVVAGGDPVRLMLLGEKLIAFRDTTGRVGVMDHRCPHRCASLFYGRNEDGGMRCVYHGWKFAADGQCLEHAEPAAGTGFQRQGARQGVQGDRAGRRDLGLYGRARAGAADAGDRGDAAAGQRSHAELHPARMQLVAGAGRRHRHLAFQLAACRFGAAGASGCGQLAAISGGQSGARVSGRRYRLGHDVLRVPPGGERPDLLALRAFRLSVLDVHSAGRVRRSGDRARLGADGRHACDVRRVHLEAGVAHRGAEGRRADPGLRRRRRTTSRTPPIGSAAGGRCRVRRTII